MRRAFCALALVTLSACSADAPAFAPPTAARSAAVKASSLADLLLTIVPDSADVARGDSVALRPMLTDPATGATREATRDEVYILGGVGLDARYAFPYYGLRDGAGRATVSMQVVVYATQGWRRTASYYAADTAVLTLVAP